MVAVAIPPILDALRKIDLLDPGERKQLERELQEGKFPDVPALARELVRRGWLTPYQVNELNRGHGRDLLVGHYVLLEKLDAGGMGQVFKARDRNLGRVVAVKVIREDRLTDTCLTRQLIGRFKLEPQAIAALSHPNIVTVHDAGEDRGRSFMVMEYLEGTDLRKLVKQRGPLRVALVCDYIRQAAQGLQHLHEHGMVHRDLKPANLLVTDREKQVKILDLGLVLVRAASAKQETNDELTSSQMLIGTRPYMAPEQRADPHAVDIRADLYSLGRTFAYLLTGQELAPAEAGKPLALPPEVPPEVAAVVRKLVAWRPEDRYQTPAELVKALTPFCGEAPLKRRRFVWAGAGIASLLVLLLLVLEVGWPFGSPSGVPPGAPSPRSSPGVRAQQPKLRATLGSRNTRHAGISSTATAISRDGKTLASSCDGRLIDLWDLASGKKTADLRGHDSWVLSLAFSPDGKTLASGSSDRTIKLWDVASGKEKATLVEPSCGRSLAFSPDGKTLVSVTGDSGGVRFWDLASGEDTIFHKHLLFGRGHGFVYPVAFSANGKTLASMSYDRTIKLWDVASGKNTATVQGHNLGLEHFSLAFSPDGKTLARGSRDGTIKLWDLASGKNTATLTGHTDSVYSVAFSPDGKTLASGDKDARIKLWDLASGKNSATLRGHTGGVGFVAISPDGKTLVSGSVDGTIKLWDMPAATKLGRIIAKPADK